MKDLIDLLSEGRSSRVLIERDDVASGQRRVDCVRLFGLTELPWVNWAALVKLTYYLLLFFVTAAVIYHYHVLQVLAFSQKHETRAVHITWLAAGGTLIFEMGLAPNARWGSASEAAPPSMEQ